MGRLTIRNTVVGKSGEKWGKVLCTFMRKENLPQQLRQMRKPYASLGSICLLVDFHDAFYDASSSRASIHSIQTMLLAVLSYIFCPAVHL